MINPFIVIVLFVTLALVPILRLLDVFIHGHPESENRKAEEWLKKHGYMK